jgi:MFS family permease
MVERSGFFYGWNIVGMSFISMTLIYGMRHSFSVFFPPILNEFGWGRGSTAIMLSLNVLIYGLLAPIAGSFGDRWKPRITMLSGIIILGLATASCALAQRLWHFYLLFGVLVPFGMAFSGWPLLTPTLTNWFAKKRGLVLGLGQMGGGLSFSYSIFAEFFISHLGWRLAYVALSVILLGILLPLYLFVFRYRPEEKGLIAYGTTESTADRALPSETSYKQDYKSTDWTLGRAMLTYQLWLMVLSKFLFWGIGCYLVFAHQVKYTIDAGYSEMFSASILALFGVFMVIGQFSSAISDRIGRENTITVSAILALIAFVALISVKDTHQPWLLYIYAICFGWGVGLYSPTVFAGIADLFYGKHFGGIAALLLTGMGMGGAVGPWLGGYIYDISGSYRAAFILCMACFAVACIAVWIAAPRNARDLKIKR